VSRKKLIRFEANKNAPNIFEPEKEGYESIKGNWHKEYFKNQNPIVLELACGRGEYTTKLGELYPNRNFIGIDIKGDRIWTGSQVALEKNLQNVAFLRTQIELLEKFFAKGEVSELWLIHPDPYLREGLEKKRLTSPRFLNIYKNIIAQEAVIHLKTDNDVLFDFSLETIAQENIKDCVHTRDLYTSPLLALHHNIQTRFELQSLKKGLTIKYLRFTLIA
jgi:tRNA (guanine-N7-)-methyltransferase